MTSEEPLGIFSMANMKSHAAVVVDATAAGTFQRCPVGFQPTLREPWIEACMSRGPLVAAGLTKHRADPRQAVARKQTDSRDRASTGGSIGDSTGNGGLAERRNPRESIYRRNHAGPTLDIRVQGERGHLVVQKRKRAAPVEPQYETYQSEMQVLVQAASHATNRKSPAETTKGRRKWIA
ncbi:hypothetical protein VTK26DRAFT_8851 [Humicola hyalothermophila]